MKHALLATTALALVLGTLLPTQAQAARHSRRSLIQRLNDSADKAQRQREARRRIREQQAREAAAQKQRPAASKPAK